MRSFLLAAAAIVVAFATPALAAEVGVSISIGQPGFYGRLDLGDFPQPQLIAPQPIIIERAVPIDRPPIYLRVPPGHIKHWKRHCREYNACGERVLFVKDNWYNREYAPRYQEKHREHREDRREENRMDDRGGSRQDHRDRGHDRGR